MVKKVDAKGRLLLGKEFANEQFIVTCVSEGAFKLEPAITVPKREAWLYENREAFSRVSKGLEQAKTGKVSSNSSCTDNEGATWIDEIAD